MRDWNYIRGLSSLRRYLAVSEPELAKRLQISLRTLGRIRDGEPVSPTTATRIVRIARKRDWSKRIQCEKPQFALRLSLKDNRIRYTRFDVVPRSALIGATALRQAFEGRAFTKHFGKQLRLLVHHCAVSDSEFSIIEADRHSSGRPVEEWNRTIHSTLDGDEIIELSIVLRERLNCWTGEPEKRSHKLAAAVAASGAANMLRVDTPKGALKTLTALEQDLLIAFGAAANELAFLARLTTICGHHTHPGKMHAAYAFSQQMTTLKLSAGKIYECWNLVRQRYFGTKLSKQCDATLPSNAVTALAELKKYFANGANIVGLIRNEAAFHFSRAPLHPALDSVPDDAVCHSYLAGVHYYLELFDFCEIAMAGHLLEQIHKDRYRAMRIIQEDIARIGSYMSWFLNQTAFTILAEAVNRAAPVSKGRMVRMQVPLERKRRNEPIPVFIRPSDYAKEWFQVSKSLRR